MPTGHQVECRVPQSITPPGCVFVAVNYAGLTNKSVRSIRCPGRSTVSSAGNSTINKVYATICVFVAGDHLHLDLWPVPFPPFFMA